MASTDTKAPLYWTKLYERRRLVLPAAYNLTSKHGSHRPINQSIFENVFTFTRSIDVLERDNLSPQKNVLSIFFLFVADVV